MEKLLEIKHISVGYKNKEIVRDVSFHLEKGELCGILGANGCGKTTLFRGITGTADVKEGECLVKGKNLYHMKPKQRAREIALLPQHMEVPQGLLVDDILTMGLYPRLTLLGLPTEAMKAEMNQVILSLGIQELLGQHYDRLSQGQKQMVLYARTLIQNTPVVLMDEPDSALDFEHKHRIFKQLRQLVRKGEKTVLLVLHDPSIALNYCHRIILMRDGSIIEEIEPGREDTIKIEEKLQRLYGRIKVHKNDDFLHVWWKE